MYVLLGSNESGDWVNTTPQYTFTASQLSEWLNIDSKHVGSILSPAAERLSSYKIGIKVENEDGDEDFDYKPLLNVLGIKKGY